MERSLLLSSIIILFLGGCSLNDDASLPGDTGTDTNVSEDTGTDTNVSEDTGTDTNAPEDTGTDTNAPEDTGTDTNAPEDTGTEGDCGPVPSDVVLMGPIPALATSDTMESIGSEVASFELPPREGATWGRLETAVTSSNNAYRWTWVSRCPGGEPLDQTHDFFGELCQTGAYEVSSLSWVAPGHEDAYRMCEIAPEQQYYFNVINGNAWDREPSESTCSVSSCTFYAVYKYRGGE